MKPFPKKFGDTTVLMATFAVDHFEPSKRYLCLLLAKGNSSKPRWLTAPADSTETAHLYLVKGAGLAFADADALIDAAKQTESFFKKQAHEFIPAGAAR